MLSSPAHPSGFIEPCLPTLAHAVPDGSRSAFEVKHDGFRFIARRDGERVRVFSRHGKDWTDKVPAIAEAMLALPVSSVALDGEGVVCDDRGVTDFERLRSALAGRAGSRAAFLFLRPARARRRGPAPASMGNPARDLDPAVAQSQSRHPPVRAPRRRR
jgi:ATP-dependent DNA ligase